MEGNICMLLVYAWGLEMSGWKKQGVFLFLFLGILTGERFILVSSSFLRVEINFDVGFIVRAINFLLIDIPSLVILHTNLKIVDF
jgi:hypothetical protein